MHREYFGEVPPFRERKPGSSGTGIGSPNWYLLADEDYKLHTIVIGADEM